MSSIVRSIVTLAFLVFLAQPAMAQQRMPGPAPQGDRPTDEQREEIRRKMEAIRIARLTEELNLDEKAAARFIPVITALDQKRRALLRENQEILRDMREILATSAPDENKLKTAIARIGRNHSEVLSLRDKEFAAIKEQLTVQQQARYLLFHQDFLREMRGMVEGARGGMAPGTAPRRGRGPFPHDIPPQE